MTEQQNREFKLRVLANVWTLVKQGVTVEEAQERVFNALNSEYPEALALWLKENK